MNLRRFLAILLVFNLNFGSLIGDTTTAIEYYQKAQTYYLMQKYYDAIDELLEAVKINPNYYEAYKFIAKIYYLLKIYNQAQFFIEKAYKMSNGDTEYKILYANILLKNNGIEQAKKFYSEVLSNQKNNIDALVGLATIFEAEGLLVAAANYYLSILEYDQSNYNAFEHLMNIYEKLNMNNKAQYLINKVRSNFTSLPSFHKKVTEFSIKTNSLGVAEKYAQNYLMLVKTTYKDLGLVDAYRLLALVYLYQSKYEDASAVLQKALFVDQDSAELYYLLGYSYLKLGEVSKAVLNLERAKNMKKDLEFYNIALEESFFVSNFRSSLQKSIGTNIEISKRYENEGVKAFKNLSLDRAIFNVKNAIDIYPDNDSARFLLAKIYKFMKLDMMAYEELYYLVEQRKSTDTKILDFYDIVAFDIRSSLFFRYGYKTISDLNKLYDNQTVYKIGIFTQNENKVFGANDLILRYAERIIDRDLNMEVVNYRFDYDKNKDYLVSSFSEEFSYARNNNLDLFLMFDLDVDVFKNSASLKVDVFSGKTGVKVQTFNYNSAGVLYLSDILTSFYRDFNDYLPKRGQILKINKDDVLMNLGHLNDVKRGDIFLVLKEGALKYNSDSSSFISYSKSDILGEIFVEEVGDYISRGILRAPALLRDYIQEGYTVFIKK
ncbi:tetratricopeptide repeat protein [Borrelia miyamotoi]|uniref:Tetratricopeptide repeat protein n=1 Tax=Borrelia miyamotoi TaxID=47466 RepID=A0AAX3JNQ2_9SPIR|nr:tetratricopeptide repeat protein [Borrelia miyamotoi]QFP42236.1 tetratricopeptide repeat protein [Borrelia miyamotoi]QFP48350.1 tetratricopeptide repeat protein [Borrelia miyamotoi]QGT56110.1 tetratricopeptide repeat protein [Borrelia miyamotoi]QGT56890.1 tetratricopeptide repeat protein [Borrelia miyamotoi]WAZ72156.1 tetratricopeptide repeat protein [Borrelia miyamotoi]